MTTATRVSLVSGSGALVTGQVISATPANLQEIVCTNTGAATVYCQVFDASSVPADATTPDIVFAVLAGTTAAYDNQQGIPFGTGISVCISSTAHTKTIGAAEAVFHALIES